jgi:glutathionylspermidine synthase
VRTILPSLDYDRYVETWDRVARAGWRELNIDTWAAGRRYLSLAVLLLTPAEAAQLRQVASIFAGLLDRAVQGILADPDWWSALAWPWPAIELARQEPSHPGGRATLYGRFDCLLDRAGYWQIIEYNADTPSGGREATGLEPALARLQPAHRRLRASLAHQVVEAIGRRIERHPRPVRSIGLVSTHDWIEDMAQTTWLAQLLTRAGFTTLVGDVNDLATRAGRVVLRGRPIDALYRFYPVERLYRHAVFGGLCEASMNGQLLMLNGLQGFVAQSKLCLAWLWSNRASLSKTEQAIIQRHLPMTVRVRDPEAFDLLPIGVVKHVNGREGDSVVFGRALQQRGSAEWEAKLLDGGYVVQRLVQSIPVEDVRVDDVHQCVTVVPERIACVGAFTIDGAFGGCYTRLDGSITTANATYVTTLRQSG